MNSIKLKLMRTHQSLFKKEFRDLANSYRKKSLSFYKVEGTDKEKIDRLLEIASAAMDENFFEYLRKNHSIFFTVNDKTPKELLHNKSFLNHIAKYSPHNIPYFPDEMLEEEHIKKYEEYIYSSEDLFFSSYIEYPNKILNNKRILDKIIETVLLKNGYITPSSLSDILRICENNNEALNRVNEELKKHNYTIEKDNYHSMPLKVQNNEMFIDEALKNDLFTFDYVPEEKKEYAVKRIIELINDDKVKMRYEGLRTDILTNPTLAHALLRHLVKKSCIHGLNSEEDLFKKDFYYSNVFPNDDLYTFLKLVNSYNFKNFSVEDQYILSKIVTSGNVKIDVRSIMTAMSNSEKLLDYYLDTEENFYTSLFQDSLWNENRVVKALNNSFIGRNHDIFDYQSIANLFKDNPRILERYLNEIESTEDILLKTKLTYALSCFDINSYTDKIFERVITQCKNDNVFKSNFFNKNMSSDNMLRLFIEKKQYDQISNFSSTAFKEDIINKLLLEYDKVSNLRLYIKDDQRYEDAIKFKSVNDIEKVFIKAFNENDGFLILKCLQEYNKLGEVNNNIESIKDEAIKKVKEKYEIKGMDKVIDEILKGNLRVSNISTIRNEESVYYALNFGNIYTIDTSEYLGNIPWDILEKLNVKHIKKVINLLKEHNVSHENITKTAINMYLTIGFDKCIELLSKDPNKNYGPISVTDINTMFSNINVQSATFDENNNPELNEDLINLIFGKNYKIKNTPIRNYLNNCKDKQEEKEEKIKRIKSNLTLTDSEKEEKIKKEEENVYKYKDEIIYLFKNMSNIFNRWDVIAEEYIKKVSKNNKLEIKLNVATINEIFKMVASRSNMPELEARDEPLTQTDVFKYVGYDNQYTNKPELAPARALELSRMMEHSRTKKFPNIKIEKDDLTLEIYNPQDRNILTAGYKSGCCFRPRGNADNSGKNNSLLTYCCTNKYGGGLKITDKEGNLVMFTPVLRNGNVLMLHSIESLKLDLDVPLKNRVHKLLREYAIKTLEEAKKCGDDISFVTITNLHHLNDEYTEKVSLAPDNKFVIYDEDGSFKDMYNNLDSTTHIVLKSAEGKNVLRDVKYGPVDIDYEYPINKYVKDLTITDEQYDEIRSVNRLHNEVVLLSNKRMALLEEGKKEEAYKLNIEIKKVKDKYLEKSSELSKKDGEILNKYNGAIIEMEKVSKVNNTMVPHDFRKCIYGNGWYIVITSDGRLIGDSLEDVKEDYISYYDGLKDVVEESKRFPSGIKMPQLIDNTQEEKTR